MSCLEHPRCYRCRSEGRSISSEPTSAQAAEEFLLTRDDARTIAGEVATGSAPWRDEAVRAGIGAGELDRMETAFEHPEAALSRRWG